MNRKLKCIMLIDDDEPTNFLSSMIIEEANCAEHVQIEDNGERAINYLANSERLGYDHKDFPWPDLIFLDINMPGMNGWEFLERYKKLGKAHESNIIIMLTTSLNPDDDIKAGNIPAISAFETKPLTSDLLNKVVSRYFEACNNK